MIAAAPDDQTSLLGRQPRRARRGGRPAQTPVAGRQRDLERLGKRHACGVVSGELVAQSQIRSPTMRAAANQRELAEVCSSVRSPCVVNLAQGRLLGVAGREAARCRWDAAHRGLRSSLLARRASAPRATIASRTAEVSTTALVRNGRARIPAVAQLPSAGPVHSPGHGRRPAFRSRVPWPVRAAHGVEKDGNELGGPAADKRRAVALLSVSQQATHHDEIASGPDGARMRGRTEITRGDRRRSPAQAGGERLRPRTVGGSRIRELRARRYRLSGFTGGDSPSAPRRSVRSPCRSNRRSARARQPRPRGTRPG